MLLWKKCKETSRIKTKYLHVDSTISRPRHDVKLSFLLSVNLA